MKFWVSELFSWFVPFVLNQFSYLLRSFLGTCEPHEHCYWQDESYAIYCPTEMLVIYPQKGIAMKCGSVLVMDEVMRQSQSCRWGFWFPLSAAVVQSTRPILCSPDISNPCSPDLNTWATMSLSNAQIEVNAWHRSLTSGSWRSRVAKRKPWILKTSLVSTGTWGKMMAPAMGAFIFSKSPAHSWLLNLRLCIVGTEPQKYVVTEYLEKQWTVAA